MNNLCYTPEEVIEFNLSKAESKVSFRLYKMIIFGIMAGAFIAIGAATSSTAAHSVANVGLSRLVAGAIFPVGLMLITFMGGELFTGNCLTAMGAMDKRFSWGMVVKDLVIIWISNLVGALLVVALTYYSGNLDYSAGLLGAYSIKVALGKCSISFAKGITSGIMCNILVCAAILLATAAKAIAGKVWAIFFPIMAFVVGGFEHCVANMFYFSMAGIFTGEMFLFILLNTLGNIIGGLLMPCMFILIKKE